MFFVCVHVFIFVLLLRISVWCCAEANPMLAEAVSSVASSIFGRLSAGTDAFIAHADTVTELFDMVCSEWWRTVVWSLPSVSESCRKSECQHS